MIVNGSKKVPKSSTFIECKICNYTTSRNSQYDRHLLTAKHINNVNGSEMVVNKFPKVPKRHLNCECGKVYKHDSGYYRHKKTCSFNANSIAIQENPVEKHSLMDVIYQNKEIMDMLVLQNKDLMNTIKDIIPKIGSNNNSNIITNTTNNQFNIQAFLNEDCKGAINFSEFIEQIKISFADLENQAEMGYVKGITKLFIESLHGLDSNKRPIHCTDKKRKTLYIKENDEWDKEGSHDTLKKGIQEITNRTMRTLMKEKADRPEEYSDMDSIFSLKCLDIQRQLIPLAPRETSIGKVVSNISEKTIIVDTNKTLG
jgi:hypothetical protein